jgi:hypothetical protein
LFELPVVLFLRGSNGELVQIDQLGPTEFMSLHVFLFYATLGAPEMPYYATTDYPGDTTLPVQFTFDSFPEEIGLELRFGNGTLVFYRPPRYYWQYDGGATIIERIPLPSVPHAYVFTVADAFGDGLEPDSAAGYIVGRTDNPIVASPFSTGPIESTAFIYPLIDGTPPLGTAPSDSPVPTATGSTTMLPTRIATVGPTPSSTPAPTVPVVDNMSKPTIPPMMAIPTGPVPTTTTSAPASAQIEPPVVDTPAPSEAVPPKKSSSYVGIWNASGVCSLFVAFIVAAATQRV